MVSHWNQNRFDVMPAFCRVMLWISAMALHANPEGNIENDVWTSVDGRKIQAQGVAWTPRGVLVRKQGLKDTVLVPYGILHADDVNRAVNSLSFDRNEDITLKVPVAETIKKREKSSVTTLEKVVVVPLDDGTDAIVEKLKTKHTYENKVGYNLEARLKSNSDPCTVWLEVYRLYQREDENIYRTHQEKRKVELGTEEATIKFDCPPEQWAVGWVALCRSTESGKVLAMASSDWQYEGYAREKLSNPRHWPNAKESNDPARETIATKSQEEYREKILGDLKLRKTGQSPLDQTLQK